jgi:hypothetical protein
MEVVNGFVCHDCTDVAYAKKGVDPAHPKDDPAGTGGPDPSKSMDRGPAVVLSGHALGVYAVTPPPRAEAPGYAPGSTVNLSA